MCPSCVRVFSIVIQKFEILITVKIKFVTKRLNFFIKGVMNKCNICPRLCGIDRKESIGYCGAKTLEISKVMKHYWEEPIISGTEGSGTIFFSHCSLRCVYCQNYLISQDEGEKISVNYLAEIFKTLENSGVNNINLVTPTHYVEEIEQAIKIYRPKIPIVWNTSGYETVETIKRVSEFVDIFLTDIKYFNSEISLRYSKADDYFEKASKAVLEMRKKYDIIINGIMKSGLIVRHLILPNQYDDSRKILKFIAEKMGTDTIISLMSQYTPNSNLSDFPEINRKIKPIEYKFVVNYAIELGFKKGFIQEFTSADCSFIPAFGNGKLIEI